MTSKKSMQPYKTGSRRRTTMKIKVNRVELKEALERVRPGLASKDIIDQATSFAFLKDRVVTYNDEISISHPVKGLASLVLSRQKPCTNS